MDQINGTPYFRDSEKKFDQDLYKKKTRTKQQQKLKKEKEK